MGVFGADFVDQESSSMVPLLEIERNIRDGKYGNKAEVIQDIGHLFSLPIMRLDRNGIVVERTNHLLHCFHLWTEENEWPWEPTVKTYHAFQNEMEDRMEKLDTRLALATQEWEQLLAQQSTPLYGVKQPPPPAPPPAPPEAPPTPKRRKVSQNERMKLANQISQLPTKYILPIISMVKADMKKEGVVEEDDDELDLLNMRDEMLRKVQTYVREAVKTVKKNYLKNTTH
jgi:hypothetical protein